MKKLLLILLCILSLVACKQQTPEDKAYSSIKTYMREKGLDDPKSYEPGEFGIMQQDSISWTIVHAFRAKNNFNALVAGEWQFKVDKRNYSVEYLNSLR